MIIFVRLVSVMCIGVVFMVGFMSFVLGIIEVVEIVI